MEKDWKDLDADEILNSKAQNTAQISRLARIMQQKNVESLNSLRDKVNGLTETIDKVSQEMAEKTDNLIGLFQKVKKSQRIIIALTIVIALSTIAYTTITWKSVSAMLEANSIQKQMLKTEKTKFELEQTLNEPMCGVKEVQLIKTGKDANGNVFGIYVILKNFGNSVARNAFYKWNTLAVENEVKNGSLSLKGVKRFSNLSGERRITLMPKSEREFFIAFIQEKTLHEFVAGYGKFIKLNIIIESKNFKKKQRYTCNYLITRLQAHTNTDNPFDVIFNDNNLSEIHNE